VKKYYLQVIIESILIGVIVYLISKCLTGKPIVISISDYVDPIIIGIVSGIIIVFVYSKLLINTKWNKWIRYLVSYIVIIIVYFGMDAYFYGISCMLYFNSYVIALIILLLATPIIVITDRNTRIYNNSLKEKKKRNLDRE
jgi:hypothetical protein